MAGRGPPPKDPSKRQRQGYAPEPVDLRRSDRVRRPPQLPKTRPDGRTWVSATREWWKTWAGSPQATVFVATDWLRLRMLAILVDDYFREPTSPRLAEIRLNEAKLGATSDDRLRLRWRVVDDGEPPRPRPSGRPRLDPRVKAAREGGKVVPIR